MAKDKIHKLLEEKAANTAELAVLKVCALCVCVCVCVCVCACACVHVHLCMCVHACPRYIVTFTVGIQTTDNIHTWRHFPSAL